MSSGAKQRRERTCRPLSHEDLLQALRDLPRAACPTPDKERYKSMSHAETAADRQWRKDGRILAPYRCVDHFHLTTSSPRRAAA